jgi:signal peptidase
MVVAVGLFATCIGAVAIRSLGIGTFLVTNASMEPTLSTGSLVIVQPVAPSLVARGDIITFDQHGQLTTRRVIAIDGANGADPAFTTKGDANALADPEAVHSSGKVGLYRTSIPLLGYPVGYAQAHWLLGLILIAAAMLFAWVTTLLHGDPAPRVRIRSSRPVLATVAIDSEDVWAKHIGWLRKASF